MKTGRNFPAASLIAGSFAPSRATSASMRRTCWPSTTWPSRSVPARRLPFFRRNLSRARSPAGFLSWFSFCVRPSSPGAFTVGAVCRSGGVRKMPLLRPHRQKNLLRLLWLLHPSARLLVQMIPKPRRPTRRPHRLRLALPAVPPPSLSPSPSPSRPGSASPPTAMSSSTAGSTPAKSAISGPVVNSWFRRGTPAGYCWS